MQYACFCVAFVYLCRIKPFEVKLKWNIDRTTQSATMGGPTDHPWFQPILHTECKYGIFNEAALCYTIMDYPWWRDIPFERPLLINI